MIFWNRSKEKVLFQVKMVMTKVKGERKGCLASLIPNAGNEPAVSGKMRTFVSSHTFPYISPTPASGARDSLVGQHR